MSLEVGDPTGVRYQTMQAVVDTGASDTVVPARILRDLGVQIQERWPFELADGRHVDMDVGWTMVRLDGRVRPVSVVFGRDDVGAALGATTLELFHLAVDPVRKQLVRVEGLLMGAARRPLGIDAGALGHSGIATQKARRAIDVEREQRHAPRAARPQASLGSPLQVRADGR